MDTIGGLIWGFSKLFIVGTILLLLGASIFWVFEKKGLVFELSRWDPTVKYAILVTYIYLLFSYILTMLSVAYVYQSPAILEYMALHPSSVIIKSLIMITILTALMEHIPYNPNTYGFKNFLWTVNSVIMGPSVAYFGTYICLETAIKIFFALLFATVISFTAPKQTYLEMKPHVHKLYLLVTISSIVTFFYNPPVNSIGLLMLAINLFGGSLLYFAIFITNTQCMLDQVSKMNYDPVYTASVMHLNTMNMFVRVAMYHVIELTNIGNLEESPAHDSS